MDERSTDEGKRVRVDRWLNAARIFPGRSQASAACDGGKVRVNGRPTKSSRPVTIGDELRVTTHRGERHLIVLDVEERRQSPKRARELYEDRTPPAPKSELEELAPIPRRERGRGRPTKRDRRDMKRWRGEPEE